MYQAKTKGRDQAVVYSDTLQEQNDARLVIETGLRRALERDELRVHYQPVVTVGTGPLVGIRSARPLGAPDRGLVPPSSSSASPKTPG